MSFSKSAVRDKSPADTFARFMRHVDMGSVPGDCWTWIGTRPGGLYGHFSVKGETHKAHRWIYETIVGTIGDGLVVRHRCDNPPCVNPQHLEVGTCAENTRDKFERGRGADRKGERHPLARLKPEDILLIRSLALGGVRQHDLAERFQMSRQQIGKIVRRQNWGHI